MENINLQRLLSSGAASHFLHLVFQLPSNRLRVSERGERKRRGGGGERERGGGGGGETEKQRETHTHTQKNRERETQRERLSE